MAILRMEKKFGCIYMSSFKVLVLFVFILFSATPKLMACGAIEGKGLHCTLAISTDEIPVGDNIGEEVFFYFKNLEVLEAYLSVNKTRVAVESKNHGPYDLSSATMIWGEGKFLVDRDTWGLTIHSAIDTYFDCQLLAAPLRKIMDHFQPQIEELMSGTPSSE